ncbi:UvrD-helicase domain-containing protein [Arthrobacter roseus]|uniref:UvrD-helicase domain-containing protein n=1 Tax=Arthrobacter roseus TaxID=136274 RepID=UPI0019629C9F|nr:UvrD-helicase domain-containing protein [Arthrobacter roseus]MBM7849599.1 DNA helicase-2/ATP-dependent DNA helicase PcrA [Arthrobacter roseus]
MSGRIIVAAAGSGKTEAIVTAALAKPISERVIITTYTTDNLSEIRQRIISKAGAVPPNITLLGWFSFLIKHGIKPFQFPTFKTNFIDGLHFARREGFPRKTDVHKYYVNPRGAVYRDFAAELALLLDTRSQGDVFRRIASIFEHILIDEVQDMSARDFEFIEGLLTSGAAITMVGDPRQGTFSTTNARANKKLTKSNVGEWFELLEKKQFATVKPYAHSYRCNQTICDYGDFIYEGRGFAPTESRQAEVTEHDGVYIVHPNDAVEYAKSFSTMALRYWVKTPTGSIPAKNFGEVKGLTFKRVLIFPTTGIGDFVRSQKELKADTQAKFYVAVTRAQHSVGIVLDSPGASGLPMWKRPV